MTQTIDQTLAERGSRYGEFTGHAAVTQGIKEAMSCGDNWEHLADDQRECLEMVAHKVGRILNGDPNYIDSWTDIIGYTRLVEKRLIDDQAEPKLAPEACAQGETAENPFIKAFLDGLTQAIKEDNEAVLKQPTDQEVTDALNLLFSAGVITHAE